MTPFVDVECPFCGATVLVRTSVRLSPVQSVDGTGVRAIVDVHMSETGHGCWDNPSGPRGGGEPLPVDVAA